MLIYTIFPLETLKKLIPNFFDKEKYVIHYENFDKEKYVIHYENFDKEMYVIHYENLKLYLRQGLKQKIHRALGWKQLQWLKPDIKFNTQKWIEAEKNNDKDGKTLYKLMNNAIYGKTMKHLTNRNNVKLVNNKKYFLKCTSKPSYMSHKIFDNNLVAIRKSKLVLKLKKQHVLECAD